MKTVSRFEAELIRRLHCFLERVPLDSLRPASTRAGLAPPCLTRDAVELVQDALAKGSVRLLAGAGWRRERHLRGERTVEGRLWERTPLAELGLTFSPHALAFLIWATETRTDSRQSRWDPPAGDLKPGDRLLLFLAYGALRHTNTGSLLRALVVIGGHGLCRLAFPEDFAEVSLRPDWVPWLSKTGSLILEAFQSRLADWWMATERAKGSIVKPQRMQALGWSQERALLGFLQAVDAANRRDLARFLLMTAAVILPAGMSARAWVGALDLEGSRLADRMETYRAALVVPRMLVEQLQPWERQARTVGYLDEGYAAAQVWKADWERFDGATLCDRAHAVIRELEPLTAERSQP